MRLRDGPHMYYDVRVPCPRRIAELQTLHHVHELHVFSICGTNMCMTSTIIMDSTSFHACACQPPHFTDPPLAALISLKWPCEDVGLICYFDELFCPV